MVRGGEIRKLETGGEGERAKAASRARKVGKTDSARAGPRAEESYEPRRELGDPAVSQFHVIRVSIEQLLELGADGVGKLAPARAVRVDEESSQRVGELQRRSVLPYRAALA